MEIKINELADYYAHTNLLFDDIYTLAVPAGNSRKGEKTNPGYCGLVVPLAGCARFTFQGTPYILKPGTIVHVGPGFPMEREVIGNNTWDHAVIHFHVINSERSNAPFYDTHFCAFVGDSPRIIDLVRRLEISSASPDSISVLRSKSLFTNLIEEFILSAKRFESTEESLLIDTAISFIHENFAEAISMESLSAHFNIPSRRFAYLFQKEVGMAPSRYLSEYRIRRAKELLKKCDCTISQVAECVGFTNAFYFSKTFKRQVGISPSQFREQVKKGI